MDKVCLEAAKEIEKIALENNISVHDLIEEYKKLILLPTKIKRISTTKMKQIYYNTKLNKRRTNF